MATLTGTGNAWGTAVKAAVDTLTIPQDRVMTPTELETVWKTICTAHVTHIIVNNLISTLVTGATGTGAAGGPLPITAVAGTGALS